LFDLQGQIALVTGASRGIGEEIAKLLAGQGAHVIVSSRKLDDCESVAREIREAGGSAEAQPCHVGRVEDILAIFQHIRARHGRLDILVNNAATNPYYGHILDTDLTSFEKTVEVNLRGYFFMSVEAGKLMREHGGGAIVNTSSQAGIKGARNFSPYITSKHAVVGITRCAALEGAPNNIRCNAICPGLIDTEMLRRLGTDDQGEYAANLERMAGTVPAGRLGTAEEVANFATWLLSEEANYISGGVFLIDGALNA